MKIETAPAGAVVVSSDEKGSMLLHVCVGDRSIPAGRSNAGDAVVLAEAAAAGGLHGITYGRR